MTGGEASSGPAHECVQGFDRAAATYERSRPDYPEAAVRCLAEALNLGPGRVVVELGAGTGKFTRQILAAGVELLAVEPMPGMREEFRRRLPHVTLVDGTAEAIPLKATYADAVVCAQSFHWFDTVRAAGEIARILRPGGGLGLVWNRRDESVPWVAELTRIIDAREAGAPRVRQNAWRAPLEATGRFTPLQSRRFFHAQKLAPEGLVDRVLSVSFIALRPPDDQAAIAAEVRALVETDPAIRGQPLIEMPYLTDVYWGFRR